MTRAREWRLAARRVSARVLTTGFLLRTDTLS